MVAAHLVSGWCPKFSSARLLFRTYASATFNKRMQGKHLISVCQLTSKEDKEENFKVCQSLIRRSAELGAEMVFLPECFDMIMDSRKKVLENLEPIDGPLITKYRELAKECKVWLSLGGLHEKDPKTESGKANNAHIVINSCGDIASIYRKAHLFNLEIPGVVRLLESEFSVAGKSIPEPVSTPVGKVGLGICYDIRFPEFAIALAKAGADILTYPSSFTVPTGYAHWETLIRARAIENQCYVVAAAQTGTHNVKRASYGHAMVVDPWGAVIAQCSEKTGLALAEVDGEFLTTTRNKLPVWTDRRPDLYGNVMAASSAEDTDTGSYHFATIQIPASQVFYRTRLSFAFVNHRPILAGHVLVSPLRVSAHRLADLSTEELSDLFQTVQKVQKAVEQEYEAKASTVAVQDGPDAGQSVEHIHVHVLPRKPSDFGGKVDQVYVDLESHDKEAYKAKHPVRTTDEMASDAQRLKKYFQ